MKFLESTSDAPAALSRCGDPRDRIEARAVGGERSALGASTLLAVGFAGLSAKTGRGPQRNEELIVQRHGGLLQRGLRVHFGCEITEAGEDTEGNSNKTTSAGNIPIAAT